MHTTCIYTHRQINLNYLNILLFLNGANVCVYVCTCECRDPQSPEDEVRSLTSGAAGSKLPDLDYGNFLGFYARVHAHNC